MTLTHFGYIKRVTADTYRAQKRGGKGITGMTTREEDYAEQIFVTSTHARNCCSSPPAAGCSSSPAMKFRKGAPPSGHRDCQPPAVGRRREGHDRHPRGRKPGRQSGDGDQERRHQKTALSEFSNMRAQRPDRRDAARRRRADRQVALTDGTRELLLGTRQACPSASTRTISA